MNEPVFLNIARLTKINPSIRHLKNKKYIQKQVIHQN